MHILAHTHIIKGNKNSSEIYGLLFKAVSGFVFYQFFWIPDLSRESLVQVREDLKRAMGIYSHNTGLQSVLS